MGEFCVCVERRGSVKKEREDQGVERWRWEGKKRRKSGTDLYK